MTTPMLNSQIERLTTEVASVAGIIPGNKAVDRLTNLKRPGTTTTSASSNILKACFSFIRTNPAYLPYIAMPLIVFVGLSLWRPSFLYNVTIGLNGDSIKDFSYRKFFTCWLVVSIVCIVSMYAYRYRQLATSAS